MEFLFYFQIKLDIKFEDPLTSKPKRIPRDPDNPSDIWQIIRCSWSRWVRAQILLREWESREGEEIDPLSSPHPSTHPEQSTEQILLTRIGSNFSPFFIHSLRRIGLYGRASERQRRQSTKIYETLSVNMRNERSTGRDINNHRDAMPTNCPNRRANDRGFRFWIL